MAMAEIAGVAVMRVSSLYETAPIPPASDGWFVNGVVLVQTQLKPETLLLELLRVERSMGRAAERARGEDRSIDLDLLLVDSQVVEQPDPSAELRTGLVLPHPRLHQRRFVLVPLCELDPDLRHPIFGVTMRQLLDRLDDPSLVRLLVPAVRSVGPGEDG